MDGDREGPSRAVNWRRNGLILGLLGAFAIGVVLADLIRDAGLYPLVDRV